MIDVNEYFINLHVDFFGVIFTLFYFVDAENRTQLLLMFLRLITFCFIFTCEYLQVRISNTWLSDIWRWEMGVKHPETGVAGCNEPMFGCWKPNLGLTQKQQVLSLLEPSLQYSVFLSSTLQQLIHRGTRSICIYGYTY